MGNQQQLASWLRSSMDPTVVSNTIRGVGTMLSGTIILVLALQGHPSSSDQVGVVVEQVAVLGGQLAAGLGAAWALYGLIMKGIMFMHGSVVPPPASGPGLVGFGPSK